MNRPASASAAPTDLSLVQRLDFIDAACRDKSVLHLGCTNWPYTKTMLDAGSLLHLRLGSVASELWGLDADPEGLATLRGRGVPNLVQGDLENLAACHLDRSFDVVLAGEVIEHLSNPGLFLRGVKPFVAPGGVLLLTTVNAYCAFRFAQYFFRGKGGVQEPVHPDHVAYYSHSTLRHLLDREGWVVDRFLFYDLGWEHVPFTARRVRWVNRAAVSLVPWCADGIIAACRPSASDS